MEIEIVKKIELTANQSQALADLSQAVYPSMAATSIPTNSIQWAATTSSVLVWDKAGESVNPEANSPIVSHHDLRESSANKPSWYLHRKMLVSHVGLLTRQGTINDSPVLIGGIGGVKTHPTARRRGYARAGVDHAIKFLRTKLAVDFSLLVCREEVVSYYARLGWHHFTGDLLVDQLAGKTKFTFNQPMVLAGCNDVPAKGVIDLCGLPW